MKAAIRKLIKLESIKLIVSLLICFSLSLLLIACAADEEPTQNILDRSLVVTDINQENYFTGSETECKQSFMRTGKDKTEFEEQIPETIGSSDAPLYFVLSVHTCDDQIIHDENKFIRSADNLKRIQDVLTPYNGKMTVQVSKRYAEWSKELEDDSLAYVAGQGSEIALHIHESYLLPSCAGLDFPGVEKGNEFASNQPISVWLDAFKQLKAEVEEVSGMSEITGFSGAPHLDERFSVAAEVGLKSTYGYKDPITRSTVEELAVLNPWRPAGSTSITEIVTYDRNGQIIFVPSGVLPVHCQEPSGIPTPFSYSSFDYVTSVMRTSLMAVDEDKINVFSVMFHPWDFESEEDFLLWEEWLSNVVAPLIDDGRVEFSTFGEVAELYEDWEAENVG